MAKKNITKYTQNDYDAAVEKIRDLLKEWFSVGLDLFLELRRVDNSGVWKATGQHANFSDFLKAEFPTAIGIDRYTNVIRAIDIYGETNVRKWGIDVSHPIIVDAICSDPKRVKMVEASINKHIETNHVPPDRNTVRDIVKGIAPETVKPHRSTRTVFKEEELQKTVQKKSEENRELKKQVKEKEQEVKKAEKQASKLLTTKEKLDMANAKIRELTNQLKEKDRLIRELKTKLAQYENRTAAE